MEFQTTDWGKLAYEETNQLNRKLAVVMPTFNNNSFYESKNNINVLNELIIFNKNLKTNFKEVVNLSLNINANNNQSYLIFIILNNQIIKKFKVNSQNYFVNFSFFAYQNNNLQVKIVSSFGFVINNFEINLTGKLETEKISYNNITCDYNNNIKMLLKHNNVYYLHNFNNVDDLVNNFNLLNYESNNVFENIITFMFISGELLFLKTQNNKIILCNENNSKSVEVFSGLEGVCTFTPINFGGIKLIVFKILNGTIFYKGYDNNLSLMVNGEISFNLKQPIAKLVPILKKDNINESAHFFAVTQKNEIYLFCFNYNMLQNLLLSGVVNFGKGTDIFAILKSGVLTTFVLHENLVVKSKYNYYLQNRQFKRFESNEILNANLGFCVFEDVVYLFNNYFDKENQ